MRREFEITDAQVATLKAAHDNCTDLSVRQAKVDIAWNKLGDELGFVGITAQPIDLQYEDMNHFTAEVKLCEKNLN